MPSKHADCRPSQAVVADDAAAAAGARATARASGRAALRTPAWPGRTAAAAAFAAVAVVAITAITSTVQAAAPLPPASSPATAADTDTRATASAPVPCPAALPADARCLAGFDAAGAGIWFAFPRDWNGTLVLHAHGGPELGAPKPERTAEDLARWAVFVRHGDAWAGTTYAQGGVEVRAASNDVERLRRRFVAEFGRPRFTLLHGQSWGAGVAERAAETFTGRPGEGRPYDAVLLTSGVLGGAASYDFRLDLRVVWQAVCANHPAPGEAAYPLWLGLPDGASMTRAELDRRIDACTGLGRLPAARSAEQQRRLQTVLAVAGLEARSLRGHLAWGTWHFRDIAVERAGSRNVFDNRSVLYRGSPDDAALNATVARYAADPAARAAFRADMDPQGAVPVPVLTLHAAHDPVAFIELESTFRATMDAAGTADRLVQVTTDDREHSYLADLEYIAARDALIAWALGGPKPAPADVAARCASLGWAAGGAAAEGCRILSDYRPAPLASRLAPR